MEHFFELPVIHNGEEISFNSRLVTFGYDYKFHIIVNGQELIFERDDDRNFRILTTTLEQKDIVLDNVLVENIIRSLETIADV
ncbi:hypothetical protein [Rhizosphaericola mali]|uniref:Uncharacterized protein n=1 Tax=Rhizosphaericola mali TaxID=2545455 RepID=A0A5P2FZQ4_9BACT|nr:hypothetical protein [Rhizosphaericola mali]QES88705.1 hypothetical protein E0W69_008585 [Rhizosphaericola mali]